MRVRYAVKSDVGMRRTHNEDFFSFDEDQQLFVVADGMGGHACGEVASRLACEAMAEFFRYSGNDADATWPYRMEPALSYAENRLSCAIKLANLRIFETARGESRYRGMGTTIVASSIVGERLGIAHVGDSRAYRIRDGAIAALTRDHSLLEDYKAVNPQMSPEEEHAFPHKNVITRALGLRETVEVTAGIVELMPGDRYLLCTDGLSGMLLDDELLRISSPPRTVQRVIDELVDAANRAGGTDNVTVLLLELVD